MATAKEGLRAATKKTKQRSPKSLQTTFPLLFYCSIYSTSSAGLSQSWENQTWTFQFCSFSFSITDTGVCKYYTYCTKQLPSYWESSFPDLEQHETCDWQATCVASNLPLYMQSVLIWTLSFKYSGHGMYNQVIPGLLNMCVTGSDNFATNQLCVSKSSIINFSINLVWLKSV